ncbi:hypothetical protein PR202_ga14885 [Eleusine coracana subsp. coracana]|uniref:Domain X domain-containing protein n=1 Tax=Eleusine coracana subsp. coracana TaxID=191504 RepID=A0AAV5CIU3_ELECO|nr:hypothetical protein PR202_ga14885 [Eleusine coracana subsp. coracana]
MAFLASGRGRLFREISRRWPLQPHRHGGYAAYSRRYSAQQFSLDRVEDAAEQPVEFPPPPMSLAKSLASLAEESAEAAQREKRPLTRMERKRLAELRVKKRVKAQYLNGKFYDLLGKVVANSETLEDAYDIIRLNSNVDLASARDDVCFCHVGGAAQEWKQFEGGARSCVYRPQFSKISHGCRSGRGYHSALRFISEEIGVPDWCFTVPVQKEVDNNVTSKLVSLIQDKIEDVQLVKFLQDMFDAKVINLVFGGYPKGHGLPQEGVLAPILMNIYLDSFDHEVFRICLKHEGLGSERTNGLEDHGQRELPCLQFAGTMIRAETKENARLKAVHKLKQKIGLLASQKQEIWDAMNLRIGKKWLAYGLRRIKESEIKSLNLSTPLLDHIAQFRKEGMKTDHWFKTLLKVWMQDVNAKNELNEDVLLSKYIAEPSLPQELKDAFNNFQKQANDYISSETAATEALLSCVKNKEPTSTCDDRVVISIHCSFELYPKCLHRYGVINLEGFPRHVSALVLQDDELIVSWFAGIINRWIRWFSEVDNFKELQHMLVERVRKSCIRTLSAKYRMYEKLTEKRFELADHGIPMVEDFEAIVKPLEYSYSLASTDEALMYGISNSGLFVLTLSRVRVPARQFNCFVMGCQSASPTVLVGNSSVLKNGPANQAGHGVAPNHCLYRLDNNLALGIRCMVAHDQKELMLAHD